MNCPHCGATNKIGFEVVDSRPRVGYHYRRRMCLMCHERFTTHEEVYFGIDAVQDKTKITHLLEEAKAFIERAELEIRSIS